MTTLTPYPLRPAAAGLVIGLLALAGCGDSGPRLVPVSGVIKLDGKPYPNAVVTFQPLGDKDNPNPGRTSSAYTDSEGRFVLLYDGMKSGAVPGKNLVRITTKGDFAMGGGEGTGSDDYTPPAGVKVDPIPPEWNGLSTKTFDVPPGGTDQANFDIQSVKKAGKKR
jgi:hypothetical protein